MKGNEVEATERTERRQKIFLVLIILFLLKIRSTPIFRLGTRSLNEHKWLAKSRTKNRNRRSASKPPMMTRPNAWPSWKQKSPLKVQADSALPTNSCHPPRRLRAKLRLT